MSKPRFYYCPVCGNIVEKVSDSGNDIECCARTMIELQAGITDGKTEWHLPVCEVKGNIICVKIGENPHPMDDNHYIEWVEIVTNMGIARKYFEPGMRPEACFSLYGGEKLCAVYAYCNLHKLWKIDII